MAGKSKRPSAEEFYSIKLECKGNLAEVARRLGATWNTVKAWDQALAVAKRFVVTYAANNTPVHGPTWASLMHYCEMNDAEMIVIPGRYRNPSAMNRNEPEWYAAEVARYLIHEERWLNGQVLVLGDLPIQPTASDPLASLEAHAQGKWAIVGHPQMSMKMLAAPMDKTPGMLHSTGTVSDRINYSSSKAGKKAALHHTFGALVVECVGERAYLRELIAGDDGVVYDVVDGPKKYSPKGVESVDQIEALVCGDEHVAVSSDRVMGATYHYGDSIVNTLKPKAIIRHDVLDFYSRNHHHVDQFQNYLKHLEGTDDVRAELEQTCEFLEATTPDFATSYVVRSNHDEALDRWIKESNPRIDPRNAELFHELSLLAYREVKKTRKHSVNLLEAYFREHIGLSDRVQFLDRDKSFSIGDVDVSCHGDKGANGGRGTLATYAKAAEKTVIGHSHTPGSKWGAWQVGHCMDDADYQTGLSTWLNTHCAIWPNFKRQFLHVMADGSWRA